MERLRNTLSAEMSSLWEVSWFYDFKIMLEDNCLYFFYLGKQMPNERKPHFNLMTNLGLKVTSLYKIWMETFVFP